MSFKALHQVLSSFNDDEGWQRQKQFQLLLVCWFEVVGPVVAAHTRPVMIQRQVLQVATSSAAWAQNLVFERHRLLEKVNARLGSNLTDIRFSAAQWHSKKSASQPVDAVAAVWQGHPSRVGDDEAIVQAIASEKSEKSEDPVEVFRGWANLVKARSHNLPLCSRCQCPTPAGEIERWSVCALCATKRWQ